MRTTAIALLVAVLIPVAGGAAVTRPVIPPARAYLDRLIASLEAQERDIPAYVTAASAAASRMAAGGTVWLAGSHRGFVVEGLGRAGGMVPMPWLTDAAAAKSGDVVLLGAIREDPADAALVADLLPRDAMVVLFAPRHWCYASAWLDPHCPAADDPEQLPIASPAIAASLWTFTGELVSALTRLGRMPAMYQSILVPGGRERFAAKQGVVWEQPIPAVRAGLLGRTYLARQTNCLRRFRGTQLDRMAEAAEMAMRAIERNHTAWVVLHGHIPPEEPGQTGDPGVLKVIPLGGEPDGLESYVQRGDVVLYVGYYEPFGPWVARVHALGGHIATVVSGTPQRGALEMGANVCMSGCWPYGDSLVGVPGYDVKILPGSGVVQSAVYWMLTAELGARVKFRRERGL